MRSEPTFLGPLADSGEKLQARQYLLFVPWPAGPPVLSTSAWMAETSNLHYRQGAYSAPYRWGVVSLTTISECDMPADCPDLPLTERAWIPSSSAAGRSILTKGWGWDSHPSPRDSEACPVLRCAGYCAPHPPPRERKASEHFRAVGCWRSESSFIQALWVGRDGSRRMPQVLVRQSFPRPRLNLPHCRSDPLLLVLLVCCPWRRLSRHLLPPPPIRNHQPRTRPLPHAASFQMLCDGLSSGLEQPQTWTDKQYTWRPRFSCLPGLSSSAPRDAARWGPWHVGRVPFIWRGRLDSTPASCCHRATWTQCGGSPDFL